MIRYLLSRNRRQQALMFLIVVLATLAALVPIHLFRLVIDRVIPARDLRLLAVLTVILLLVVALSAVLEYLKTVQARRIQDFFINDLRTTLTSHLMNLPADYFAVNPVGKLLNRVMHDVSRFGSGIESLLVNPVISLITIAIYSLYLFSISPLLTLLALLPLPLLLGASLKLSKVLRRQRAAIVGAASDYSASVNELMLGSTEIQSNGSNERERRRLQREHGILSRAVMQEGALLGGISAASLLVSRYRADSGVLLRRLAGPERQSQSGQHRRVFGGVWRAVSGYRYLDQLRTAVSERA